MSQETNYNFDLLAIGPHPDDVEMSCGGLLAKMAAAGQQTAVLDLSRGELGSRGTAEIRDREAAEAATVLGLAHRENLGLPDGWIGVDKQQLSFEEQLQKTVSALRRLRPKLLLLPYWQARHPDHSSASELLTRAAFYAGTKKFEIAEKFEGEKTLPYRPLQVLYYSQRVPFNPSFVVDISEFVEIKMNAFRCYASQIHPNQAASNESSIVDKGAAQELAPTLIGSERAVDAIVTRDNYYGSMIGTESGEPYLCRNVLPISNPLEHFEKHPTHLSLYFPS